MSDYGLDYLDNSCGKSGADDLSEASTVDDAFDTPNLSEVESNNVQDEDEDEVICIEDDDEAVALRPPGVWASQAQMCVAMVPVALDSWQAQWTTGSWEQRLERRQAVPSKSLDESVSLDLGSCKWGDLCEDE